MIEETDNISIALKNEVNGVDFGRVVVEVSMEVQNGKVVMATLKPISREVKVKFYAKN